MSPWNCWSPNLSNVDLQGPFQPLGRGEVGDVARVADADLLVGLAFRREVALRPGELGAEEVALAVAFVLRRGRRRRRAGEAEPAGGGGCIASYSLAGISRWIAHTLVIPKRSSSDSARADGVPGPKRRKAVEAKAVARTKNRRLIAPPQGVDLGRTEESAAERGDPSPLAIEMRPAVVCSARVPFFRSPRPGGRSPGPNGLTACHERVPRLAGALRCR